MSMHGRVINFKYNQALTDDDSGEEWTGKYKWDEATKTYLDDMKASMTNKVYWWNLFTTQGKMAFRVPNKSGSTEGFYTLHMEANLSIIVKYQVGSPTDAQLWTLADNE
ncbi:hypothetical protein DFJ58DRAFT_743894 [Suillus subalutaceus]|uniref:uncharacterized protein n=1 Tax=Suillus subalutaceus TaxID=48586 RepID=UPI001B869856|nr:uncharacterized protein DFJ58DRAFT_743894 [Suillus subalutaceus]KAG1862737.1 hypothetical protein DFJ58DRAFT_743894 [Suillus subalutaceus]